MECPVSRVVPDKQQTIAHDSKCPFNHGQVWVNTTQSTTDTAAVGQPADVHSDKSLQSSEAVAALNGCPLGYAASVSSAQDAPPAVCPMGHGFEPGAAHARLDDAESSPTPAQCPMGFTASDGPRMTQLHCVICKSLLYDCVQLSCSCKYCRYCVANFSDCPLCGADIISRTAATKLQGTCCAIRCVCRAICNLGVTYSTPCMMHLGDYLYAEMVDTYINAHAGTQNLFDIGKTQTDVKVWCCDLSISQCWNVVTCMRNRMQHPYMFSITNTHVHAGW